MEQTLGVKRGVGYGANLGSKEGGRICSKPLSKEGVGYTENLGSKEEGRIFSKPWGSKV